MAVEEEAELPDWLQPSMPEEEQPEWLQPTTVAEIPPPPTPDVPEDEPETSYWSQFGKWAAGPAVRTLLNLQDIKQADVGTAGRAVARAGVRSAEDLVNTANDFTNALGVTPITERVNWEEEWLGKPENAVEEIAAEMGSWVTAFAGPGGVVKAGLKTFSTTTKISSKADDVIKLIGKTEKGRKALKVGRIAGEGALKGAVADFITTDVDDVEAEEALYKRLTNTIEGAAIGAGFNLGLYGAIKGARPVKKYIDMYFRRAKALRAVKKSSEGKGDHTAALKQLKESLDEEAALKEEMLTAIRPIDDRVDNVPAEELRQLDVIKGVETPETSVWSGLSETEELFKTPVIDSTDFRDIANKLGISGTVVPRTAPGIPKTGDQTIFDVIDTESAANLTSKQVGELYPFQLEKAQKGNKFGLEEGTPYFTTGVWTKRQDNFPTLDQTKDLITLDLGDKQIIEVKALSTGRLGQGQKVYQAAMQFAHNTNNVYVPVNLSFINVQRTLGAMFSSALKNKTTKHFAPLGGEQADQMAAMGLPKGYEWGQDFQKDLQYLAIGERNLVKDRLSKTFKYGSEKQKEGAKSVIRAEAKESTLNLDDYKYSFEDDVFTGPRADGSVGELSTEDIINLIKSVDPDFTLGIGASTFKRAVVTDSIEKMPFIVGDTAAAKIAERVGTLKGVKGVFPIRAGKEAIDTTLGVKQSVSDSFRDSVLLEKVVAKQQTAAPVTLRAALQDLKDLSAGELGEYSNVVDKLLALGKDTGIDFKIEERAFAGKIPKGFEESEAFFDQAGKRVVLDINSNVVQRNPVYTLLHETTHAVTVDNVYKHFDANVFNKIDLNDIAARAKAVDGMLKQKGIPKPVAEVFRMFKKADAMRDDIIKAGADSDLYWISNPGEFMSFAFTDVKLQQALKGIQYTPKMTLWEKIVNTVKNLLGKGVNTDLADSIVSRVGEIAEMRLPREAGEEAFGITGKRVPKFAEDQIENYIDKGQDLPDQVNRLVRLNVELDKTMNPKINGLVERLSEFDVDLEKGITKDLGGQFEGIKGDVLNLEEDLIKYRKMIDLRAKAGNLSGKLLVSFKGKSKMNFRKPIKYKPAVQKQFESIDRLLSLIDGIKSGELTNDNILKALKKELSNADELANTGDLRSIIDKEFGLTVDDAIDTIWGKYKERISNQVLKTLRLNKGTNKAALDMFSQRLTKNLTEAVQVNKPIVKKVNQTLDNLQDILNNPEKYKESIDVLIKDISEAKNLDPQKAAEATRILNELKEGAFGKRFLESMPQRDKMIQKVLSEEVEGLNAKIKQAVKGGTEKELVEDVVTDISKRITNLSPNEKQVLVDMIRVELANSISAMRERILGNFISKEIYQKYALKHTIEELEEMSDKSIAEIREYLGTSAKKAQTVPADIKRLKDQARAARKVLTDKLKEEEAAAYNEFVVQFLKSLSKMDAFGMEEMGTFELLLRNGEKFRLNAMLASVRTWTVGFLSASFNMGYLPFKQMLKRYNEIKIRQAQGDKVYGPEVSAMKLALQELKATSEYFNNWGDMLTILKATWKQNGHGAFNAKAFRRHEEDLIQKTAKQETEALKKGPIKLNFKNKDQLQRMVNKYGVDSDRNRGLLRKFLEETVEGEPTTAVGKMLDPLFSVSFRVMGLFDQPFVFMGTMRALRSEAMQEGLLKGLEGKALNQFAKKRMSEALKRDGDVLTWAQNEEFHEASELGFAMVYQQDYADKVISRLARDFSRWSRSSEDAYRDPIKIVSRLLVPFIKTPTAIAQWTVDNLPVLAHYNWAKATLGSTRSAKKLKEVEQTILKNTEALKSDVIPKDEIKRIEDANEVLFEQRNELTLKKAEEQAEAAANGISSTVLGAAVMTGIATGNITGSGAHLSDDQRARLREAGWRPNTLYIGGYKIDYSRFEPFSTMVSVHADFIHYLMLSGEELTPDDQEWYNVLHASFVTNFSDKYFLRGLKSIFSLLDYKPGNYAMESAAVDFLSSFSPSLLRDLNQVNQEFQTRANSFKDKLLERSAGVFPGLYARNLLGEKVDRQWQREGAWGVLSPVYFAEDKRDKLMTELASIREDVGGRYNFNKTEKEKIDTRDFKNPKTNLSLYDEWMDEMSKVRLGGKTLRRSLEALIKTQRYKKAPNFEVSDVEDTKAKLVREKIKEYRDRAWIEIRKDRKIRKYQNAQGEAWFDVITGKLLEPNRRTSVSDDIVDISLPKQ